MSEWQPIETAPKDGTVFVSWAPDELHSEGGYWCLLYWEGKNYSAFVEYWDGEPPGAEPKHWMSLPEPPQ